MLQTCEGSGSAPFGLVVLEALLGSEKEIWEAFLLARLASIMLAGLLGVLLQALHGFQAGSDCLQQTASSAHELRRRAVGLAFEYGLQHVREHEVKAAQACLSLSR